METDGLTREKAGSCGGDKGNACDEMTRLQANTSVRDGANERVNVNVEAVIDNENQASRMSLDEGGVSEDDDRSPSVAVLMRECGCGI
jgi:hypothetical protein